jgi:hypothetical protein
MVRMTTGIEGRSARRVVLTNMTRILAAIMRNLVGREADLVYAGDVALAELPTVLPTLRPDVVVLSPPRSERARAARDELRTVAFDLTVVELRPRDDRAVIWRPGFGPEHIALTSSGIVAALRGVPAGRDLGGGPL